MPVCSLRCQPGGEEIISQALFLEICASSAASGSGGGKAKQVGIRNGFKTVFGRAGETKSTGKAFVCTTC